MSNPHLKIFLPEDEDYAFKGKPPSSRYVQCVLCNVIFDGHFRGPKYKCREHARTDRHQREVRAKLRSNPVALFKYEAKWYSEWRQQNGLEVNIDVEPIEGSSESHVSGQGEVSAPNVHVAISDLSFEHNYAREYSNDEVAYNTAAIEGAIVFHTIKSYQSINSVTDLAKLITIAYDKNFSCSKTKANAIFRGVLAPHSREKTLNEFKGARYCTVHFDCSNHGEVKMLAILVRFYDCRLGAQTRVLDIISARRETAEILAEQLWKVIEEFGLKDKIVAICADNASTNFGGVTRGGHNNILERISNNSQCLHSLFGIGCLCHIVNNCIQNGVNNLIPCKIASILGNLHAWFDGQTVRWNRFSTFCMNRRDHSGKIARVIPLKPPSFSKTRWLSLFPGLDVLERMYPYFKEYFLQLRIQRRNKVD